MKVEATSPVHGTLVSGKKRISGFAFSITVLNALALVARIQHEMEADGYFMEMSHLRKQGPLDVTSHHLRQYFLHKNIFPYESEDYKGYFIAEPAEIALTYEWDLKFSSIEQFLNDRNIKENNKWIPLDNTFLERLYIMSFGWICQGSCNFLPTDIGNKRIFIDILIINQQSDDIHVELETAEHVYSEALYHLCIGTARVFTRAWCLFELAVRKLARKRTHFVIAPAAALVSAQQIKRSKVGFVGAIFALLFRGFFAFIPNCVMGFFYNCIRKLDLDYSFISVVRSGAMMANLQFKEFKVFGLRFKYPWLDLDSTVNHNFFDTMTAFKDSDMIEIKRKILAAFHTKHVFNKRIGTAAVGFGGWYSKAALFYWVDTLLLIGAIPFHLVCGTLSLGAAFVIGPCLYCIRLDKVFEIPEQNQSSEVKELERGQVGNAQNEGPSNVNHGTSTIKRIPSNYDKLKAANLLGSRLFLEKWVVLDIAIKLLFAIICFSPILVAVGSILFLFGVLYGICISFCGARDPPAPPSEQSTTVLDPVGLFVNPAPAPALLPSDPISVPNGQT